MSRRIPVLTLLLCGLNSLLLAVVCWRALDGSKRDELVQSAGHAPQTTALDLSLPSVPDASVIQAQAIFHKTRAFYVAPVAPIVQQAVPDLRLAGSMSIPNQPSAALLVNPQSGARTKVHVGDQLEGWTVAEIGPRRVVLQLGDRREEITNSSGSIASGMTTSAMSPGAAAPAGGIRVLSGVGSGAAAISRPSTPLNDAPRLYRPPRP
jgi:hypothetical protein